MLRKRQEYRANVADLKKNTPIGVSLPFNGSAVFNLTYTTKDQVKSNLINFLLTNRGERPFNPEFGADIRRHLFDPITSADEIKEIISDKIGFYIPQITLGSIDIIRNDDFNTIYIQLTYSINNQQDTVTIQFQ